MKKYLIYKATSPSGKSYIGVTSDLTRRKSAHKRAAEKGSNLFFHTAIRKYGFDVFIWEVLMSDLSDVEAFTEEKRLIEELELTDKDKGYNLQVGGRYFSWTEEIRARHKLSVNRESCIRARKEKYDKQRPQVAAKISKIARINSTNLAKPFYGFNPVKDELLTFKALFEVEEALGLSPRAVHRCLSGKTSYYKGFVFRYVNQVNDINVFKTESLNLISSRHERMALARAKASGIRAINIKTGEIRVYTYIGDFQKEINGSRSVINAVLNKAKLSYKGWKLEYIKDENNSQ